MKLKKDSEEKQELAEEQVKQESALQKLSNEHDAERLKAEEQDDGRSKAEELDAGHLKVETGGDWRGLAPSRAGAVGAQSSRVGDPDCGQVSPVSPE